MKVTPVTEVGESTVTITMPLQDAMRLKHDVAATGGYRLNYLWLRLNFAGVPAANKSQDPVLEVKRHPGEERVTGYMLEVDPDEAAEIRTYIGNTPHTSRRAAMHDALELAGVGEFEYNPL